MDHYSLSSLRRYDILLYAHYIVRSLSHAIFWDILIFLGHLLSIRSLYRTIFCLYGHYIPYDLYPIRSFGIRSFSLTIFCAYDHLSIRSLYRTIFILYDLLAYDHFPWRSFANTIFCPYDNYAVRSLSHTIFWHMINFLGFYALRSSAIRPFVRLPQVVRFYKILRAKILAVTSDATRPNDTVIRHGVGGGYKHKYFGG